MNRYSIYFLTLITALCAYSCKKDKKQTPPTPIDNPLAPVYVNYTQLTPGNYWIYEDYMLDSVTGTAHELGTFDSAFVEKDTTINGNNYHKYWDATSSTYHYSFLRDSLSYTVNSYGRILFSSTDFGTVFKTTNYTNPPAGITDTIQVTEQMGFKNDPVYVPAGTFTTSVFRQIFNMPNYPFGTREYDYHYAANTGLVSYTTAFYTNSPKMYERRLVRYHVQVIMQ